MRIATLITFGLLTTAAAGCGADEKTADRAAGPPAETITIDAEAPVAPATVVARIPIGKEPCSVAAAGGLVWVSDYEAGRVLAVDPASNEVVRTVEVHDEACELAADGDRVWVLTDFGDYLEGIDARTGRIFGRIRGERGRGRPAIGDGDIWWSSDTQNQVVSRYDSDGRLKTRIERVGSLEAGPADLALAAGAVWVGNEDATVQRIDPQSDRVTDTIEAGPKPAFLTFHDGGLWFANLEQRTMRRLDPQTKRVTHVIKGGGGEFAFDEEGSLWAVGANPETPTGEPEPALLYRFDARSGEPTARLQIGDTPRKAGEAPPLSGIAVAAGSVWVGSPATGDLYRIDPRG